MSELITISPIDGQELLRRPHATDADLDRISHAARHAQTDWARQPLSARIALLEKAIHTVLERSETFARSITEQMGRPISQAPGELRGFAERGRYMLSVAQEALAPLALPAKDNLQRAIEREPVGVVLTIAPWNYPLLTAVNSIIPALAAGNSVILKHSDQTPLCAEQLVQAFTDAGLPAGLFQYIHATHEAIRKLIQSPAIDYVAFTGSVRGGAAVEEASVGRFIGRGLELGGNDPAYVRADADLNQAVETLVDGAFFNSGQSCCGIQRIYVDQSRYQAFVDQAVALTEQYRLGDPLDPHTNLGPVVRQRAAEEIRGAIQQSISLGARNCINPEHFGMARPGSTYLAPSILTQVNHDMPVMNEECFGPVVSIMPVSTDQQALDLMNDCRYGLTAAIFTQDMDAARHLGQQLQTGTVFMNRCDYLDPALAWTGVKNTGHGISLSIYGYHMLTRVKSYHFRAL
ncbi:aldehyde dehydrogenase family protein [Castellaniella sp.]|uniref:aldehyde dehydrogenase family protein n=1 Tax=Castellaniella sp. TaxID=1955812 RepID=UPI002AFE54BC|nr:aldehyde dehydrogenase family protein [Castellaniella sp.]